MRRRRSRGVIRMAFLFVGFLVSLSLVVWRQSRALDLLSDLDTVRRERAVAEAQRATLVRELDVLESRSRITELVSGSGMRVPRGDEIILLPLDVVAGEGGSPAVAAAVPRGPLEGGRRDQAGGDR